MRTWLMLLTLALLGFHESPAQAQQGFLHCASNGYRYQFCSANTQGRVVLVREVSTGNLCRQGRGWGFDNSGIWVDRGCRADFSFGRDGGNWSGGDWTGPNTLVCESIGYRRNFCRADTQNRVNLMREISTGNLCRQGWGWGFDGGGIWVDRGCRGEFSFGRSNNRDRNNDAAIAAGVIGALALGAAIGAANTPQAAPAAPPPPPPLTPGQQRPPAWMIGSFQGFDPDTGDIVTLVVSGAGHAYLRSETGDIVSEGALRDGVIVWSNGQRSWIASEGPGLLLGDINSGRHFYFRRNA